MEFLRRATKSHLQPGIPFGFADVTMEVSLICLWTIPFKLLISFQTMCNIDCTGCPYTASWLAQIDILMRTSFTINSTKMEDASFALLQQSGESVTYQVSRPDLYYVNHLSEYEHRIRKKTHNISEAIRRSALMSETALATECGTGHRSDTPHRGRHTALMPFYGGMPADTDLASLKVKSVGEGNSVVNRTVKAWQGMATVCSLIKYFDRIVVGVSSVEDELVIRQHVSCFVFDNYVSIYPNYILNIGSFLC